MEAYPDRGNEPEVVTYRGTFVGGTTALSVSSQGQGMTPAHGGSTGKYQITLPSDEVGQFAGWTCNLAAATPSALAGHTVVRDTYNASTKVLEFWLFNASDAAHDLAAAEYFDIEIRIQRTSL